MVACVEGKQESRFQVRVEGLGKKYFNTCSMKGHDCISHDTVIRLVPSLVRFLYLFFNLNDLLSSDMLHDATFLKHVRRRGFSGDVGLLFSPWWLSGR